MTAESMSWGLCGVMWCGMVWWGGVWYDEVSVQVRHAPVSVLWPALLPSPHPVACAVHSWRTFLRAMTSSVRKDNFHQRRKKSRKQPRGYRFINYPALAWKFPHPDYYTFPPFIFLTSLPMRTRGSSSSLTPNPSLPVYVSRQLAKSPQLRRLQNVTVIAQNVAWEDMRGHERTCRHACGGGRGGDSEWQVRG
jgi:hypothetical protein